MTLIHYLKLAGLTILSYLAVYLVQLPLRKKAKKAAGFIVWLLKWALIIWLAYLLIAYASPFLWRYGYAVAAVYLALLGDVIADVFAAVLNQENRRRYRKYMAGLATLAVTVYAVVNMQVIVPQYHTYSSDRLQHTYKIVFAADLHFGSAQGRQTVYRALEKIREENPDYLLFGGDITDEHTTKEEMTELFARIGELGIPTYYVYGNHDRQDRGDYIGGRRFTEQELEDAITGNGITILYNDWIQAEADLVFLGMEDSSRPEKRLRPAELRPRPEDAFVLCVDHSPYQNDDIREINADLQLSGHTHAGQLFPLKWVYSLIGLNVYGDYVIGDTQLYVTSGITGWYLPLRNEAHCNYEVITLQPAAGQ